MRVGKAIFRRIETQFANEQIGVEFAVGTLQAQIELKFLS